MPTEVDGDATPVIVFTGGGTGGHIYPGLAVIEALKTAGFRGRIVWIGSKKPGDRAIVARAGVEYLSIPSGKLRRRFSLENLGDAFRVAAGYFSSRAILGSLKPSLVFSKGGYVSVPPCMAAASLGIPVVTHESDLTPGLATRLNARRAKSILTSYPETTGRFPEDQRSRVKVVGNPVRSVFRQADAARGRRVLGVPDGLAIVFFVGGSQGARQINDIVRSIATDLVERVFVVHQTGESGGADGFFIPANHPERYAPFTYIHEEMPHILAAADIVVGRSGAGTLWECGAQGKPMVLIPLCGSGTRGDQVDNAELFGKEGAARVFVGPDATPNAVRGAIFRYIDNPEERRKAGEASRRLAGSDAASEIARFIISNVEVKP